jgi:hypothetical protein
MVDEVVSSGGAGQIAQEATLQQLLNAVAGSSGASAAMQVEKLAKASGVAAKAEEDFAAKVVKSTEAAQGLLKSFVNGTATASGLFGAMGSLPGPIGLVFKGLSMIAGFQEEAMVQYREMTKSGVGFGGALSDLRVVAAQTHMTLSQFANLIKNNGETLARLGGSANDGAKAFVKLSTEIMSSDTGNKLKSLGYSAEEVNQGMLNYIQMTGGRSAEELKNTKALTAGASEYLTQLDGLAQLTGKSREQQEKELKEAQQNAAIQQKLGGMDEKQKAAYQRGLAEMTAKFGKAGAEMYQAQVLGIPPQTEAARNLMALAPEVANASAGMADVAKRGGDAAETMKYSAKATEGAVQASKKYGDSLKAAMSFRTDGTAQAINALGMSALQAEKAGRETSEKELAQRAKIAAEQKQRQESQAAEMVHVDQAMKEFSVTLLTAISPFVKVLTWVIDKFSFLVPVIGAVAIGLVAMKAAVLAQNALASAKAGFANGGLRGMLGGGGEAAPSGTGAIAGAGGGRGGFVGFIRSLGRSLASLAPIAVPMLIGAGAVAGVIAILGAGVAAAIALIGVGLPVFAKGLKEIADIDGLNLAKVAGALALLGPAMVIFSGSMIAAGLMTAGSKLVNFFSGGGPIDQVKTSVSELGPLIPSMERIGPALNNYAAGIVAFGRAVSTVDLGKAERLKEVMKGPGVLEGIGTAIRDVGSATAKLMTSNAGGQEKSGIELASLNNSIRELIKVSREISDYTKQTVEATKKMSGDHFA